VDLVALSHAVVRRVHVVHPELDCAIEAAPHTPEALADADKIEQVLTNLLENGVKYATPGAMRVRISLVPGAEAVELCVDDEGPGLTPAERERIFDRFASVSGGRPSGLGLGLWIARAIAAAHAGTLDAVGNARGGTTFRLTLPVSTPTD
jgi:signal transduction histidine kinase